MQPISDQQPPWKDSIFTADHDGIEYCFGQFGFAVPAASPQPLACLQITCWEGLKNREGFSFGLVLGLTDAVH